MPYQVNSNIIPYQLHEYNQRKVQNYVIEEPRGHLLQGYEERSVQVLNG
jgi:hypothetical protein